MRTDISDPRHVGQPRGGRQGNGTASRFRRKRPPLPTERHQQRKPSRSSLLTIAFVSRTGGVSHRRFLRRRKRHKQIVPGNGLKSEGKPLKLVAWLRSR